MSLYWGNKKVSLYLGGKKVRLALGGRVFITIDPYRYYKYITADFHWTDAGDSYSIAIPCKAYTKYKITVPAETPYEGIENLIFRVGTTTLNVDKDNIPINPLLTGIYRGTPQEKSELIFTTGANTKTIVVQMGRSAFAKILANGAITCEEFI